MSSANERRLLAALGAVGAAVTSQVDLDPELRDAIDQVAALLDDGKPAAKAFSLDGVNFTEDDVRQAVVSGFAQVSDDEKLLRAFQGALSNPATRRAIVNDAKGELHSMYRREVMGKLD